MQYALSVGFCPGKRDMLYVYIHVVYMLKLEIGKNLYHYVAARSNLT